MTTPSTGDARAEDVWINVPYYAGIDPRFYHAVVSARSPFVAGGRFRVRSAV